MKRIFLTIAFALLCVSSFAQLNGQTVEESRGYKTVYKVPMNYGEIRYADGIYFLCGGTDNRYETTMATILLGGDKESAICSLEDIRKILFHETQLPKGGLVVDGMGGKKTTIFRGAGEFSFKTDGVAGTAHTLWVLKGNIQKAEDAIENFEE